MKLDTLRSSYAQITFFFFISINKYPHLYMAFGVSEKIVLSDTKLVLKKLLLFLKQTKKIQFHRCQSKNEVIDEHVSK